MISWQNNLLSYSYHVKSKSVYLALSLRFFYDVHYVYAYGKNYKLVTITYDKSYKGPIFDNNKM